jgi:hypothetical protein
MAARWGLAIAAGAMVATALPTPRAVHGRDRLRGWAEPIVPNQVLLRLRGRDPDTAKPLHAVNPAFGRAVVASGATVFVFGIDVKVQLGRAPEAQMLDRALTKQEQGRDEGDRRADCQSVQAYDTKHLCDDPGGK